MWAVHDGTARDSEADRLLCNSKKDVVVVALSQDEEPSELAAVRKLVEKTLAEAKINLTGNPVGQIGLDPSKSVGSAFAVEGYPTLVILDGKGTIQSVHLGFDREAAEPLHKTLAKEIDTAATRESRWQVPTTRPTRPRRRTSKRSSDEYQGQNPHNGNGRY